MAKKKIGLVIYGLSIIDKNNKRIDLNSGLCGKSFVIDLLK